MFDVFSWLDWGLTFLARIPQKWCCALPSASCHGVYGIICLITAEVDLTHLVKVWWLPSFSKVLCRTTLWDYASVVCHITLFLADFSILQWFLQEAVTTGVCLMVIFCFSHWTTLQLISSTTTISCETVHSTVSPWFSLQFTHLLQQLVYSNFVFTMFVALFGCFLENG